MKKQSLALALGILFLSGCSQVRVATPNPRVEVPEVRGDQYKWKFAVAGGNAHMFRATGEGGQRPPDLSQPQVRGHADVYPGAYFAPHEQVEVGADLNVLGWGANLIGKWQFLGDGTRHATEGNVPVAFFVRTGLASGSNNGDQKELFGDGGYNWSSKSHNSYVHAGLSAGYRVSEVALLYAGFAYGKYWADVEINQDATGTDPGGHYESSYAGDGRTIGAGAMWNWKFVQFYVGAEYTAIDYGSTDDMESLFLHTGVTFTPGNSPAPKGE